MSSVGINFYEKQIARKQNELALIELELETVQEKVRENKLMKQAKQLLAEIKQLEQELSKLNLESDNNNVQMTALDDTLRTINFDCAKEIARNLHLKFESQDDRLGAAVLLLQKPTMQMGGYCVDRMLSTIFEDNIQNVLLFENLRGKCEVFPVVWNDSNAGTPLEFLEQICRQKGIAVSTDRSALNESFRELLCKSLRSGDRVVILIRDCHHLVDPQEFLLWFIEDFWKLLIEEIQHSVMPKYKLIRFIAVLTFEDQIDRMNIPLCTVDEFDPCHLMDIPLPNWTIDDIDKWLARFQKMENNESKRKAQDILTKSGGIPQLVCLNLKDDYSNDKSR